MKGISHKQQRAKIAILICQRYYSSPTSIDNYLFLSALEKANLEYELVIWDEDDICWDKYSAVLVRATWDYIDKTTKFIKTLENIAKRNISIFNSLDTIRWNSSKQYLLELQARGVDIINTLIMSQQTINRVTTFISEIEADEYVIKPLISAGAFKTYRVKPTDISKTLSMYFEKDEEVLIQPFLPEIMHEGEWSLIFFDGVYSHAVLLKPAVGDFRVQLKHGGFAQTVQPTEKMILKAQSVISLVAARPLYARVDFIRKDDKELLMELELIEPDLFFSWHPPAASGFVEALLHRLNLEST